MTPALTVIVADDHAVFREGLAALLEASGIVVLAQAGTGEEALAALERTAPRILLVDVEMPGPGIRELVRRAVALRPGVLVAVLTMHADHALADELEALGAAGYFVKNIGHRALTAALRTLDEGGRGVRVLPRSIDARRARSAGLTDRETEVLRQLARARSNARIAEELHLSEATVKRHLTSAYRKLGASSRLEALDRARHLGIVGRP